MHPMRQPKRLGTTLQDRSERLAEADSFANSYSHSSFFTLLRNQYVGNGVLF